MLTVVKLGGRVVEDGGALRRAARGIRDLPGPVVVVHGGGSEISAWFERLRLPVVWRDGLRVTTGEGVQVTSMVLTGWVNKRIVAALLEAGVDAVGLAGEDGGLLRAERKDRGALGEVGTVVDVRVELLEALLGEGLTPVLSPVSRGPGGVPLNVNADEAAGAVAAALGARELLLLSDVPGVLARGVPRAELTLPEAASLLARGEVSGGMRIKVESALRAAQAGARVVIGGPELLRDPEAGTRVVHTGIPVEA